MGTLFQDLRYALRQLRRSPGFAVTAVLTLALGIGATTAIFTLVHAILLKSLPVTRPNELYRIGDKVHCCGWGGYTQEGEFSLFSDDLYRHFRDNTPEFEDLGAFEAGNVDLGVRRAGSSQPAVDHNGEFVSANFFRTFGIRPWIGRLLNQADDREGAPPVAVLSYHVWQQRYGSDPSVVGSTFTINSKPFTVVGVAAPGFFGASLRSWAMPEFWMPLADEPLLTGKTSRLKSPNEHWLDIIGRARPGTDPKLLEAKLRLELRQWQTGHLPDMNAQEKEAFPRQALHLTPGGAGVTDMREQYEDGLRLLLAAAASVLLIACANLANLLLARGLRNRQQTSLRVALGASRMRLVRKALVESFLLALLGGAAGIGVAYAGTSLILHLAFSGQWTYVPIDAAPSWPVLLFALGIALLTGICFGIAPAWMTSRAEPVEALRGANRSTGNGAKWPQRMLVVAQAAVSLVLISAAAMLAQSLRNLEHQNFGFDTTDRYLVSINPLLAGYQPEQLDLLYKRLEERLQRIPGVKGLTAATYAPMSGDSWNCSVRVQGKPEPHANEDDGAAWTRITPGFFQAVGDHILMGRPVDEHDTATSVQVAVVNQTFAKKFFKGENPIGKHFGKDETGHAGDYVIVGVAGDMEYLPYYALRAIPRAMFYLPESQSVSFADTSESNGEAWSHYLSSIVLWVPGTSTGLEAHVRQALAEVDPNLTLEGFQTYTQVLQQNFGQQGLIANLTLLFGALALLLAAVGLYGVTAYTVEQRTNEIGIRMALGANRGSVLSMVLRSAFVQVGVGLAIGIPASIGAGRAITTQLYAVKSYDPAILALAALLLALAALLAAALPARRAANVNPVQALRSE
jgi:predicted permease